MKTFLLREHLPKINSLTKYPSILTYHVLGEKGRLGASRNVEFMGEVIATEKIDGTNTRLIWTPEGLLVGSREDLLWSADDLIYNPAQGIVDTVRELAFALKGQTFPDALVVFYGEVFGHKVGAASKQYTKSTRTDFRLFDVCRISKGALAELMTRPVEDLAVWRESGHQPFASAYELDTLTSALGIQRVPSCGSFEAIQIPKELAATKAFLSQFARSAARLDDTGLGESEGIILRSKDRRQIAKLRFEDYRRSVIH